MCVQTIFLKLKHFLRGRRRKQRNEIEEVTAAEV
jgi:hypothetical protein